MVVCACFLLPSNQLVGQKNVLSAACNKESEEDNMKSTDNSERASADVTRSAPHVVSVSVKYIFHCLASLVLFLLAPFVILSFVLPLRPVIH